MTQLREAELDAALQNLQQTLRFWKTWEAEYAGLKEELEAETSEPDASRMLEIADNYGSTIIDLKEFHSMLQLANSASRNRAQILNMIKDRITLAERNASTIHGQIALLDPLTSPLIRATDVVRAEDQTEIIEQLGSDDIVLSSKTENYAGLLNRARADYDETRVAPTTAVDSEPVHHASNGTQTSMASVNCEKVRAFQSSALTKATDDPHPSNRHAPALFARDDASGNGSCRDAATNDVRQTLESLQPIVASLDLEDGVSDEEGSDNSSLEENDYGMNSISDQMDEEYVRQMEALIEKYKIQVAAEPIPTLAAGQEPNALAHSLPYQASNDDTGILSATSAAPNTASKPKKEVRFAESLQPSVAVSDVLPPNSAAGTSVQSITLGKLAPMADIVVEKNLPNEYPQHVTRSASTIERASTLPTAPSSGGQDPNEVAAVSNEAIDLQTELALYSQRMDNHAVDLRAFRQDEIEVTEATANQGRKISKFKAARLGLREC